MRWSGSGSAGWEAAVQNCLRPGDHVVATVCGSFGDRFATVSERLGLRVTRIDVAWGEPVTADLVAGTLADQHDVRAVMVTHNETSTGVTNLLREIAEVVHPTWVGADVDSWGIDHGTWSVLMHAFPDADIPVVQLSLNALKSFDYHLQLGAALAPLRERGVLVIGSGNVVHNLGGVSRAMPDAGFDWAQRFDGHAKERMLTEPADVARLDVREPSLEEIFLDYYGADAA